MPKDKKKFNNPAGNVHKGNVKPVSSSRMAELLNSSGGLGSIGFTGDGGPPYASRSSEREEKDEDCSGDLEGRFQVALKLLSKRDTQTKLKALQDFSALCQNEPKDTVLATRKVWVMTYNRLTLDDDHRVRDACHSAMKHFVSAVKRDFAPSLKTVIGSWVCGMNDPYSGVVASARDAFETSFSKEKQIEVLKFAFSEIVAHMSELISPVNLLVGRRFSSDQERSLLLDLAALQGISGFCSFLVLLPQQVVEQRIEEINSLWTAQSTWALAKHKSASVRATLFKTCPTLFTIHKDIDNTTAMGCIFGRLKTESDPLVVPHLWQAVVTVVSQVQGWYNHVDVPSTLVPGLQSLLDTGGHGSLQKTFPLVPVLLEHAYQQLRAANGSFGVELFERLSKSWCREANRQLNSEVEVFFTTYSQVSTYLVINHPGDLKRESFVAQMSSLMEASITPSTRASNAPSLCGSTLGKMLLLEQTPRDFKEDLLVKFEATCVKSLHVENSGGKGVDKCSKFIVSVLNCFFSPQETGSVRDSRGNRDTLLASVSAICLKSFTLALEERSLCHMRLFASVMEASYGLELNLPAIVGSLLDVPSSATDCQSASHLLDLHFTGLKTFCSADAISEVELVSEITASLVFVASAVEPLSAPLHRIEEFCHDYPSTLPVILKKVLASPLKEQGVPLLLPGMSDPRHATLSAVRRSVDTLSKVISCEEEWVSVEVSAQLLANIVESSLRILELCDGEEIAKGKQIYFELLCEASTKSLGVELLPKVERLLCSLVEHLLSIHVSTEECTYGKALATCFSHLTGLCCSHQGRSVLPAVCSSVLATLEDTEIDRFSAGAEFFAKLLKPAPGISFWDVVEVMSFDSECLVYPSPSIVRALARGELLYSNATLPAALEQSNAAVLYRGALLLAHSLLSGPALEGEGLAGEGPGAWRLERSVNLMVLLCWGCRSASAPDRLISGDRQSSKSKYCDCPFNESLRHLWLSLTLSAEPGLLEGVVESCARVGGWSSEAVGHLLYLCYSSEDTAKTIGAELTSLCLRTVGVETYQCSVNALGSGKEALRSVPPASPLVFTNAEEFASVLGRLVVYCRTDQENATDRYREALLLVADLLDKERILKWDHRISEVSAWEQDILLYTILVVEDMVLSSTMPEESWDFTLCLLLTCCQSLASEAQRSPGLSLLYTNVLRLCQRLSRFFTEDGSGSSHSQEWADFFKPNIMDVLLPHCEQLMGAPSDLPLVDLTLAAQLGHLCSQWSEEMSRQSSLDLPCLARALGCGTYCFQSAAYSMLLRSKSLFDENSVIESTIVQELKPFIDAVVAAVQTSSSRGPGLAEVGLTVKDALLSPSSLLPTNPALLLLWAVVTELAEQTALLVRVEIQDLLKETNTFDALMLQICLYLSITGPHSAMELRRPGVLVELEAHSLASFVVWKIAQQFPVMLRQWYLGLSRHDAFEFQRFTSQLVSSHIRRSQLKALQGSIGDFSHENMEVRVFSEVSEVSVSYKVEEVSVDLVVVLPEDYPLHPATVREGKRVRVAAAQWRKWMLQLHIFLNKQNGSIYDGLMLWKSNLDKHFAGVQECMICFSIVHTSNYSLPKLGCKTCHHDFHTVCLYKWFNTSGKSTCPLCRNLF